MRTIFWDYDTNEVKMIDQRLLPETFVVVSYRTHVEVAHSITDMVIRGAPAIGAAAAFGLALAARESKANTPRELLTDLQAAGETLKAARPTAVNLAWAVDRILRSAASSDVTTADELRQCVLVEAQKLADEEVRARPKPRRPRIDVFPPRP